LSACVIASSVIAPVTNGKHDVHERDDELVGRGVLDGSADRARFSDVADVAEPGAACLLGCQCSRVCSEISRRSFSAKAA
jgi:hypothetical protein